MHFIHLFFIPSIIEFLEGKTRDVEESADDMEVESDSEGKETLEDNNGPLLPPEAFQPINVGEEAEKQETGTLKRSIHTKFILESLRWLPRVFI